MATETITASGQVVAEAVWMDQQQRLLWRQGFGWWLHRCFPEQSTLEPLVVGVSGCCLVEGEEGWEEEGWIAEMSELGLPQAILTHSFLT